MKIVKIFGLVVAVHAAVFLLIFAIPGCRSSARKESTDGRSPGAASVAVTGAGAPAAAGGAGNGAGRPIGINATDTQPRPVAATDVSSVRFSPTRPTTVAGAPTLPSAPSLDPVPEPAAAVYTVASGDSLWAVAKKHGVSVQDLTAVNSLRNTSLKPGQTLIIPRAESPAEADAPAGLAATADRPTYTVKAGDSLNVIARRNGTTVAALKSANRLTSDIVRPGQKLVLPSDSTPAPAPAVQGAPVSAQVSVPAPAPSRGGSGVTHTVAPGDTLSDIAKKYGVSFSEIATANNIQNPRSLRPGQVLTIPGWQAPAGGATKTAAAPASTPAPAPAPAPAPSVPTLTPRPSATDSAPTINLIIPGASQPQAPAGDVPVIRVEESRSDDGAPRIE